MAALGEAERDADSDSHAKRISADVARALLKQRAAREDITEEERKELLLKRYAAFNDRTEFAPGDLVRWKPGLRNKGGITYSGHAVVVEMLPEPIFDGTRDAGSSYFREPLDMIIAFLDPDNDFITLHVDSRRFEMAST
ncbi:hypothetical protein [Thiohalocapsa sp. ML1]|uniref:hypothetical protein n=1 Tax=Thiohalocapsa sp. ML1 TaxID=1431688 RepID=UPI0012E3CE42|nr:hypothetical protein [Thiohalocapsa sp. ML1]